MSKVARMFSNAVDDSGKTQSQISEEIGFTTASIISLLRTGRSKIPMSRIDKIAEVLGVDEASLLRACLKEYEPELFKVVERVYNADKLSVGEREIIERIRVHTGGKSVSMKASQLADLDAFAKNLH